VRRACVVGLGDQPSQAQSMAMREVARGASWNMPLAICIPNLGAPVAVAVEKGRAGAPQSQEDGGPGRWLDVARLGP